MKLVSAFKAQKNCVELLESLSPEDTARGEILAFYMAASERVALVDGNPATQIDLRLPVPDYIAEFAAVPG